MNTVLKDQVAWYVGKFLSSLVTGQKGLSFMELVTFEIRIINKYGYIRGHVHTYITFHENVPFRS
jgi:hypothetical protein